jgi:hypothetical protein
MTEYLIKFFYENDDQKIVDSTSLMLINSCPCAGCGEQFRKYDVYKINVVSGCGRHYHPSCYTKYNGKCSCGDCKIFEINKTIKNDETIVDSTSMMWNYYCPCAGCGKQFRRYDVYKINVVSSCGRPFHPLCYEKYDGKCFCENCKRREINKLTPHEEDMLCRQFLKMRGWSGSYDTVNQDWEREYFASLHHPCNYKEEKQKIIDLHNQRELELIVPQVIILKVNFLEKISTKCYICQEDDKNHTDVCSLNCRHIFCKLCIETLLKTPKADNSKNFSCPLCRTTITHIYHRIQN